MAVGIPTPTKGHEPTPVLVALKQAIESITGQLRDSEEIDELPNSATNAEIVSTLNKLIRRLR